MTESPIEQVVTPVTHDLGAFQVRRAIPSRQRTMVGPFIFVDQFGPAHLPDGQAMDVRPHPHINLATVTWLFEGAIDHRDSLGSYATIRPGQVNLMTAGSGIVHSERSPVSERAGGPKLYGMQTWLALPDGMEEIPPAFEAQTEHDIVYRVMNEPAPRLGEAVPGVPGELDELVARCLAKERGERPTSIAAVHDVLARVARGDPWSEEQARAWWERHGGARP